MLERVLHPAHWILRASVCGAVVYVAARALVWLEVHAVGRFAELPTEVAPTSGARQIAAAVLSCVIAALFCWTGRLLWSIAVVAWLHSMFVWISILKLRVLQIPLHPSDVQYLSDLALLRAPSGPCPVALAASIAGGIVFAVAGLVRRRKAVPSRGFRAVALCLVGLLVVAGAAHRRGVADAWLRGMGVEQQEFDPMTSAATNGLLLEFVLDALLMGGHTLPGYGRVAVAAAAERYQPALPAGGSATPHVNLIVYLIEAFVDPAALGFATTTDAIPTFRRLRDAHPSGWVSTPVFGGMSANAEFELLTGMSMRFVPDRAAPYKRYIRRPIPSLPRTLRDAGYSTSVLHAASLAFFRYREVYPLLGFDHVETLYDRDDVPRDLAGQGASDQALVDAIVARSQDERPFFIFAFANSTHYPWTYQGYESSDLDVLGLASEEDRRIVRTYLNALRDADRAVARLIAHFEQHAEPTAILILGDHLPALPLSVYRTLGILDDAASLATLRDRHRVPAVLWTNFSPVHAVLDVSMNLIPGQLLDVLGVASTGLLAVTNRLRHELPVASAYLRTTDGKVAVSRDELEPALRDALVDYELLQFDVLLGNAYSLQQQP